MGEMLKERISRILEHWFISEPALFQVLCSHELAENPSIACPVRSGRRRVEYNPIFLTNMTDQALDEALRTEAVRILLKHPYERKPDMCCDQAVAVGSQITIGDNYGFGSLRIDVPGDYDLAGGMPYEWYSRRIQELLPASDGGGCSPDGSLSETGRMLSENARADADRSELWEEDELAVAQINGIIDSVKEWGSLAGNFAEKLRASTRARISWRNVFDGFRASIISSRMVLTRMRPSRRFGFDQMGSRRQWTTKLLVAVDVSGSVDSRSLSYFFGVVNSAFRYGFESIDVLQFDHGIRGVMSLRKAVRDVAVFGRGGTSFQEPVDYAYEHSYDGLVILTDGYAPCPEIRDGFRTRILWVCEDEKSYETHRDWMGKTGRVCMIQLH